MPYNKIGVKNLASAITSCRPSIVCYSNLNVLYDNGILYRVISNILQAEGIRKVRCGKGKREIHTSLNFRTFLGDLAPSGIKSDRSDRRGQST
jgi:hypothetical protein